MARAEASIGCRSDLRAAGPTSDICQRPEAPIYTVVTSAADYSASVVAIVAPRRYWSSSQEPPLQPTSQGAPHRATSPLCLMTSGIRLTLAVQRQKSSVIGCRRQTCRHGNGRRCLVTCGMRLTADGGPPGPGELQESATEVEPSIERLRGFATVRG